MKARKLYKKFLGREPRGTFNVRLPAGVKAPRNMALLGKVVEVRGTWRDVDIALVFTGTRAEALLLGTQRGQLYIYDKGAGLSAIPQVKEIVYKARKRDGKLANYVHGFKAPFPRLVVLAKSKRKLARLQGGRYKIEARGIVG